VVISRNKGEPEEGEGTVHDEKHPFILLLSGRELVLYRGKPILKLLC